MRKTFKNFAIIIRLSDGSTCETVIRETSRRIACGRALSSATAETVVWIRAEDEMTNDQKGRWDMPSYVAPSQRPIDYSVLDVF